MQNIRIIGFLFESRIHWQFEVGKKVHKRLFCATYLPTDKTLIHNSLYVFRNWEKKLKP